ncbi:hypothetical protein [Gimesia sp.]|uniref:hypothetical protein n=1 Tax=Gimesia sp. TaxID=2024833 RepID=UPI003A8E507B
MFKRVTSWLNSLLLSPPALCAMLVIFFTGSLLLCNYLIQVDAEGRPLARKRAVFKNHPVTQELIEATSELNWQTDPEQVSRVDELCETLAQMKSDREQNLVSSTGDSDVADYQNWFVDITVPVRQASTDSIRESEM